MGYDRGDHFAAMETAGLLIGRPNILSHNLTGWVWEAATEGRLQYHDGYSPPYPSQTRPS